MRKRKTIRVERVRSAVRHDGIDEVHQVAGVILRVDGWGAQWAETMKKACDAVERYAGWRLSTSQRRRLAVLRARG